VTVVVPVAMTVITIAPFPHRRHTLMIGTLVIGECRSCKRCRQGTRRQDDE
jgi:hypothetical protein